MRARQHLHFFEFLAYILLCGNRDGEMDTRIIVQCLGFRVQISGDIFVLIGYSSCISSSTIFAICGWAI